MSDRPTLSVVVASNGARGSVERCLAALAPQLDGAELVVCSPAPPGAELRSRFPEAIWHVRPGALVPVLWRDGIACSGGDFVALTISPMIPGADWVASLRRALATAGAVGGAVEPGEDLRLRDLAECFCRYAADMPPFARSASLDLPGDNAGYRRARLLAVEASWRDGFWEPDVHRALAAHGDTLVHDPAVVVAMGRSAGALAFLRQRLLHGRAYGRARGARFGAVRNALGVVLSPLVPVVLLARTVRHARRRGRGRELAPAVPLVLLFDVAWAGGEAVGHLEALGRR